MEPAALSKQTHKAGNFYRADISSLASETNIGRLVKEVYSSMNRTMARNVAPLGLTAMQWLPLVAMRFKNLNTPAELARHTGVDTGAMTRTLDRLEAKGFLTRQRCENDRRVVKLELTETGRIAVDGILPAVADTLNQHLSGFNQAEFNTLFSLLRRMADNGQQGEGNASRGT
jgi:DNA-binding MarR family transcriptional regulator